MTKTCSKCKETKPVADYSKRTERPDGKESRCRDCHREYRQANKTSIQAKHKRYCKKNRATVSERARQYQRKRRKDDPMFRLRHNVRGRIYNAIINGGYSKASKTHEILGCTHKELQQHIESQFTEGMSWDRISEIHIDHRLPVSAANTEEELLALNHHRNLQPMWASDNLAKSDSYCPKELAAYLAKYK